MKTSPVRVEILEQSPNSIKLKTPFVSVPIEMSHNFFLKRLEQGYFLLDKTQADQLGMSQQGH
jgi:hypothetical protein